MWGNPNHLNEMARTIKEVHRLQAPVTDDQKVDLHVIQANSNSEEFTYDGIDWGAERVAEEVSSSCLSAFLPNSSGTAASPGSRETEGRGPAREAHQHLRL
jgi:hypothetical protein